MKVTQIWIVFRKFFFKNYVWLSNEAINVTHTEAGGSCGGLAVALEGIQSIPCAENGVGYICQVPSGKQCPMYFSYMCVMFDDFHFVVGCGVSDWYDAQSLCLSFGGHLAVLDSEAKIRRVLDFIKKKALFDKCGWSFAGLRKEEWRAPVNGTDIRPRKLSWTETRAPSVTSNDTCLCFNPLVNHMTACDCASQRDVLCQYYGEGQPNITLTKKEYYYNRGTVAALILLKIVLLVGLLIVLSILIVSNRIKMYPIQEGWRQKAVSFVSSPFCSIRKRITGQSHPDSDTRPEDIELEESNTPMPENENLLGSEQQVQSVNQTRPVIEAGQKQHDIPQHVQKPTRSHVRVIIFSDGVDEQLPDFKDSAVLNIRLHPCASKNNGNKIVTRITETFQNLVESPVSVINIITTVNLDNYKLEAAKSIQSQVLEFLLANCDRKSVIFLPYNTTYDFEKVRQLREKAVVLTLAHMMPEFPSTEVITALGERKGDKRFKVADIVVPVDEERLSGKEVEMAGAAIAVALAAAILHHGKDQLKDVHDQTSLISRAMAAFIAKYSDVFTSSTVGKVNKIELCEMLTAIKGQQNKGFLGWQSVEDVSVDATDNAQSKTPGPGKEEPIMNVAFLVEKNKQKFEDRISFFKDEKWKGEYICLTGGETRQSKDLKDSVIPEEVKYYQNTATQYIQDAHKFIRITIFEINPEDINCLNNVRNILQGINDKNYFHIVFHKCIDTDFPEDHPLMLVAYDLKNRSVFLSAAKAAKCFVPQFPVTFAVATGISKCDPKKQVQGAALDFVCGNSLSEGAISTAVLVTTFLKEAICEIGIDDNMIKKICKTKVMHRILREMSSHSTWHDQKEGWGVLDLKQAIQSKIKDHHQLRKLCSVNPNAIYWNGKNI